MGLEVIEDLSHKILNPFLLENGVRLIANDDGKQSASRVIGEMCRPNIKLSTYSQYFWLVSDTVLFDAMTLFRMR